MPKLRERSAIACTIESRAGCRAADGANFGGDKKKWEATLAQRNNSQNEYLRTDTKK